jgi:hypothetical protein
MLLGPATGIKKIKTPSFEGEGGGVRYLLTSDNFLDLLPQSALLRSLGGFVYGFTLFL